MLPDYESWALFASVAEHGSFRGAASASGVSVPTVSKAISRLETRLGLALFHRTSRRVTLSAAGSGLADHARAIVASGRAAEEAARADSADLAGPIRLTAPMSLGMACLGDPIAEFCAMHPAVTIELTLSDAQCDLVADGIDLALRIAELVDSSLLSQTIAPIASSLVASPAYLAAHGTPQHPRDLTQHRVLGYGHNGVASSIRLIHASGERAQVSPTGPLSANNGDVMVPLLVAGQGIAPLPHFILGEALGEGRLVRVLPDWERPRTSLSLVSPPSRLRPARVAALAGHLVRRLKAHCLLAADQSRSGTGTLKPLSVIETIAYSPTR